MLLKDLVKAEAEIAATSGTLEKEARIRKLLKDADLDAPCVALMLCGKLTVPPDDRTTGIKEAFLAEDLAIDTRALEDIVRVAGTRVEPIRKQVSVQQVWDILQDYLDKPTRTKAVKSVLVTRAMEVSNNPQEISFLLRLLCGKMSNGVKEARICGAIGLSDRAYAMRPDLLYWVAAWRDGGLKAWVADVSPQPCVPLEPQLCARVKSLEEVLEVHGGETLVQPKLDGMRVQVHKDRYDVRIFTRALKDITADYPEVAKATLDLNAESCIIDGELVAVAQDGDILPFGALQKRLGRKTGREKVKVGVVAYDLLYDEGPVHDHPYSARLADLVGIVPKNDPVIRVIPSVCFTDVADLRQLLLDCYEAGREGLVCKDPQGLMQPGARSKEFIKLKPDYMAETEFGDSFDLVVIGFNWGRGKRHGKVGALWLGAPVGNRYPPDVMTVCKVGTGFTDEELDWWTSQEKRVGDCPNEMDGTFLNGDYVVEVRAAEVTKTDKGISLRFPRYLRRRNDKTVGQCTTLEEIRATMKVVA